mmetsp:Transcript_26017/g.85545  ORF Transcript_26017/g.85545 Transcript_26017/m.85545 type:complete len:239 (-) Transcript_26017:509-1225(-)
MVGFSADARARECRSRGCGGGCGGPRERDAPRQSRHRLLRHPALHPDRLGYARVSAARPPRHLQPPPRSAPHRERARPDRVGVRRVGRGAPRGPAQPPRPPGLAQGRGVPLHRSSLHRGRGGARSLASHRGPALSPPRAARGGDDVQGVARGGAEARRAPGGERRRRGYMEGDRSEQRVRSCARAHLSCTAPEPSRERGDHRTRAPAQERPTPKLCRNRNAVTISTCACWDKAPRGKL